jgi:hypothetical protein
LTEEAVRLNQVRKESRGLFVLMRAGKIAIFPVPIRHILVGYAVSPETAYCVNLPFSLYVRMSISSRMAVLSGTAIIPLD